MAPKAPPKFTSLAKPPEISTMTQEEIDQIYRKMEKRITEMEKKRWIRR
jgi:predicted transcriptional regulator